MCSLNPPSVRSISLAFINPFSSKLNSLYKMRINFTASSHLYTKLIPWVSWHFIECYLLTDYTHNSFILSESLYVTQSYIRWEICEGWSSLSARVYRLPHKAKKESILKRNVERRKGVEVKGRGRAWLLYEGEVRGAKRR